MSVESLEFEPNTFSLVTMIKVLEHIVDYVMALKEVHRVFKKGGYIFIQSTMCTDRKSIEDETHIHVLNPVTLPRLLKFMGFEVIKTVLNGNFAMYAEKL